jgi:fermentation-respiration switch protein FrsA (DUF1100 family)
MHRIEFQLQVSGIDIAGELFSTGGKRCPGLCVCHGIPAAQYDPSDLRYNKMAESFSKAGFTTAIFNFRGAGRSGGNLDLVGWMDDLKTVIGYMTASEWVDETRIAVLGSSAGGAVAACVAAEDKRVAYLALMASPADFDGLVDPDKAGPFVKYLRGIGLIRDTDFPKDLQEWATGFARVSPIKAMDRIAPRPVLILHGDNDDTVPMEHAQRLFDSARQPKELMIVPGAGHRLRLDENALNAARTWLKRVSKN